MIKIIINILVLENERQKATDPKIESELSAEISKNVSYLKTFHHQDSDELAEFIRIIRNDKE